MVQKCGILKKPKKYSVEMDFWRRSARKSRRDKIPNHVIRQKIGYELLFGLYKNGIRPKNGRQRMAPTSAGADATSRDEDRKTEELDRWKETRMRQQRGEWKDSGWTEKNGDWEPKDVSDVKKTMHAYILT
jgi:hypothetical protein